MATEKRLIDANAVLEKYWKLLFGDVYITVQNVRSLIETEPTVDAVEVVHSQFRKSNEEIENYGYCYCCIECGATMMVEDKKFHDTAPNWCALCGAKMDREMDSNLLFADMEEIIDATD